MQLARRKVIVAGLASAKLRELPTIVAGLRAALEAAGATVVGEVLQRRGVSRGARPGGAQRMDQPLSSRTVIGDGKARELAALCGTTGADLVVFLNPLTERQRAALSELTAVSVREASALGLPTTRR